MKNGERNVYERELIALTVATRTKKLNCIAYTTGGPRLAFTFCAKSFVQLLLAFLRCFFFVVFFLLFAFLCINGKSNK